MGTDAVPWNGRGIQNPGLCNGRGDAANYHVALDSGVIGIEKCAKVIESLA